MRGNFDAATDALVLILETGKVAITDDPDDPGGYTAYGIAQNYHKNINVREKIKSMDDAKPLYLSDYWIPAGCDTFKYPLDVAVFIGAINQGVAGVKEILKRMVPPYNEYEFMLHQLLRYRMRSKAKYKDGHYNRVLDTFDYLVDRKE